MYLEGRNHVGGLVATTRQLAIEILASLAHAAVEDEVPVEDPEDSDTEDAVTRANVDEPPSLDGATDTVVEPCRQRSTTEDLEEDRIDILVLDTVRLLKMFYFAVIEHVRSNEGVRAWTAANDMVMLHATKAERSEFETEFGGVQPPGVRKPVQPDAEGIGGGGCPPDLHRPRELFARESNKSSSCARVPLGVARLVDQRPKFGPTWQARRGSTTPPAPSHCLS